ncbi:bifunctional glycosyltransferase/CDP-glycerol:glycerophosphate glycerophosphotransferase [Actinacidiphila oryziradicis]|uniref:bifunctional glycosyltransferase/CDP-glycerol:glycerophosphate glycerophosphotransferase n=1 Tax=Actinacidiphila oryziradicis TaxID=2571141 RepID=UPI0023F0DBBB|nr:bifunctional glycosyltransferase/CDP-glycerol:glycerophosphate glycerophosphotransferase [Actinacidiphila oryziradicis]MCW2872278.1 glycosyl transferase [Actinacidiphila oryziradicis]
MPRFSIIVPAYKVQAYLHECMESVLAQSFSDFELIAVNDCSPDSSGEILDEFADRDSRVSAVHLPENVGLGRARNAGMARATGDYVLFLDSDDTLAPGSLQAIADRLKETAEPDILIYDYDRAHWNGRTVRNRRADLLVQHDPQVFTLADRPDLLRLLQVVWNKAYRRDFIEQRGFSFPPGYYEDTPWTYPTLIAARSLTVLDRVCVHYRQRRQGNILGTTSRKHFDVFEQYDRVFAFLDGPSVPASWRPVIFRRMLDHFTTIYRTPGRLPRRTRAEFFRRSRAYYRRYRPAGAAAAVTGSRRTRLRYLLLGLGVRRTFDALDRVLRTRARLRRCGRRAYVRLRAGVLQLHYRVQRHRRLDPNLAVFAAYWERGYACNPAAIEAAVRKFAPHIRTAWITTPKYAHTLPSGVRRLHPGSSAYWTALARATYLVNNVNFPHRYRKRPGQTNLHTHHGTPLKHMGLDLQDHPAAALDMDFRRLLGHVDRWDYSLSANRHSTLVWERAYPAGFTSLEYGYPRNDIFQTADADDVLRIRTRLGIPDGATAVLYAPTHRDYQRGFVPPVDLERLARELGPGYVILVRAHYLHNAKAALPESVIDVCAHPSVEELCLASDVLLTDYSSVMFDYANLDRPIVIHAEDWTAYRAARGVYFDLPAEPPGLVARTQDELIDILATDAWRGPRSTELRAAFRSRFCALDDGHAAERVVRHLFLGQHSPLPALVPLVPLESRHPAPAPTHALLLAAAGPDVPAPTACRR